MLAQETPTSKAGVQLAVRVPVGLWIKASEYKFGHQKTRMSTGETLNKNCKVGGSVQKVVVARDGTCIELGSGCYLHCWE